MYHARSSPIFLDGRAPVEVAARLLFAFRTRANLPLSAEAKLLTQRFAPGVTASNLEVHLRHRPTSNS